MLHCPEIHRMPPIHTCAGYAGHAGQRSRPLPLMRTSLTLICCATFAGPLFACRGRAEFMGIILMIVISRCRSARPSRFDFNSQQQHQPLPGHHHPRYKDSPTSSESTLTNDHPPSKDVPLTLPIYRIPSTQSLHRPSLHAHSFVAYLFYFVSRQEHVEAANAVTCHQRT